MIIEVKQEFLKTLSIKDVEEMHDINDLDFVVNDGKLFFVIE